MDFIWRLFGGCPGKKGDLLIFTKRNDHNHYAVNVGEGYIIHTETCCRDLAKIKKEKYRDFIRGKNYKVRVENSMTSKDKERLVTETVVTTAKYELSPSWNLRWCRNLEPYLDLFYERNTNLLDLEDKETLSVEEIVKRANSRIDMNNYSWSLNNCESFALWCRYGKKNRHPAELEGDIDTIVRSVYLSGNKIQGFSLVHSFSKGAHPEHIERIIRHFIKTKLPQLLGVRIPHDLGLQDARYQADSIGKAGDLLRFQRYGGLYEHYAVNVGYGYLVHSSSVSDEQLGLADLGCCCLSSNIAVIKLEYYSDAVKTTDKVNVENSMTWNGTERLPTEEIVKRALSQVGERGYIGIWNNCEHFARSCRYNEKECTQVIPIIRAILVIVIAVALYYFLGRSS